MNKKKNTCCGLVLRNVKSLPCYQLIVCHVLQFLVSVSKENSSTAEVLESISRSVRVKPENLRLAEVLQILNITEMEKVRDIRLSSSRHVFFLFSGGEEPIPAHVPAVSFPGHCVIF